jgi:Holliday junction resolvase RusA-like endonuclease
MLMARGRRQAPSRREIAAALAMQAPLGAKPAPPAEPAVRNHRTTDAGPAVALVPPLAILGTAEPGRVTITMQGTPVSWKRPTPNWKQQGVHTNPESDFYFGMLRSEATRIMQGQLLLEGGLELSLLAIFPVPQSWSLKKQRWALEGIVQKTSRPDLSNLIKGAEDSLQGVVYRDDAAIVSYGACAKVYGPRAALMLRFVELEQPRQALLGMPLSPQTGLFDQLPVQRKNGVGR